MRVYMLIGDVPNPYYSETIGPTIRKTHIRKPLGFVRTEVQARKAIPHIKEYTENISNLEYEKNDIPTDKDGFIKWLNEFCYQLEGVPQLIEEVLEEH